MLTNPMSAVIQRLRSLLRLPEGVDLTDGQLLECYVSRQEPAAAEELLRRHGPMVWGVCRRLLHNEQDAEDAFQATFLVFVRRAASIQRPEQLANWLYGVARQTALKARATTARRSTRERQVSPMPESEAAQQGLWDDLGLVLDEEVGSLPDKYRAVVILCELEGMSRQQAARSLGCPEGTVASRLSRAREMLAKRLTRRGVALSGGALAALVSQQTASAGVPVSVMRAALEAVTRVAAGQALSSAVSGTVAALAEGVLKAMLLSRLKLASALLVILALVGTGAGAYGLLRPLEATGPRPETAGEKPARAEVEGERLPEARPKAGAEPEDPPAAGRAPAPHPEVAVASADAGFEAVVNDATRGFTRQKQSPESFYYGKLTLDSKGRVVNTIIKEGLLTQETKVVLGVQDEKKKWVPREAVVGGVKADFFQEAGKVVQVRVSLAEDQKTIRQILVTKTDQPLVMADAEFDAILKQVGPQTDGRGLIWYTRLELDEKGNVVKTFALTSGRVTKETKVVLGRYNEKEGAWEAGEPIPNGLYGQIFKNLGAKTMQVRLTFRDDRKGIAQVLVRPTPEKGK